MGETGLTYLRALTVNDPDGSYELGAGDAAVILTDIEDIERRAEKAERERDEARREAEKWRCWALHAPAEIPADGRLPWERGGDDGG